MTRFRSLVERTHRIKDGKVLCPAHQEDTPSCHIYDDHAFCFGCGKTMYPSVWIKVVEGLEMKDALARAKEEGFDVIGNRKVAPPMRERPQQDDRRAIDSATALWRETTPLAGTAGAAYFADRGVGMDLPDNVVRFHAAYPLGKALRVPAVVVRADDRTGKMVGIQAIPVDRKHAKKSRGRPSLGAVYLGHRKHPVALVAESVVSALSAWLLIPDPDGEGACPVATLGTGAMKNYRPLATCRKVVIAADNDDAGRRAALALKRNLDVPCRIMLPGGEGADANNWLQALGGAT